MSIANAQTHIHHNEKNKWKEQNKNAREKEEDDDETFNHKQETNAQKWELKKKVIEITIIMTINSAVQASKRHSTHSQHVPK